MEIILSNSTWTKVASNIVIDVNTSASVVGNGNALGLTDGTDLFGLQGNNGAGTVSTSSFYTRTSAYPSQTAVPLRSATTMAKFNTQNVALGVSTQPLESGLKATITRTNLTVNIWKRTA